jgi:hypothetical protein
MYIVIDFDGTVVTHDYPRVGVSIGAVPVLKKLIENKHQLILFTMRGGDKLKDAVNWFEENEIPLFGIQTNPSQHEWTDSPKAYGQLIIDDAALGCPLMMSSLSNRPYVNWEIVEQYLVNNKIIK